MSVLCNPDIGVLRVINKTIIKPDFNFIRTQLQIKRIKLKSVMQVKKFSVTLKLMPHLALILCIWCYCLSLMNVVPRLNKFEGSGSNKTYNCLQHSTYNNIHLTTNFDYYLPSKHHYTRKEKRRNFPLKDLYNLEEKKAKLAAWRVRFILVSTSRLIIKVLDRYENRICKTGQHLTL